MTEVIKEIKGFEGRYTISNFGIVRSLLTGNVMKLNITKFGYYRVNLRFANSRKYKTYFVHRLVAMNFLDNPNNCSEVNHIDSNKLNNNVTNLEWCNREHNIQHSFKYGYASNKGTKNPNHKLSTKEVEEIRKLKQTTKIYNTEIAKLYNVSSSTINLIVREVTWSNN